MAVREEALHILFFPFLASGHLIPIADMAALFAGRGVKCTILTTPVNAAIIRSAVDRANDAFAGTGSPAIDIAVVPFPDVGLPPGVENGTALSSQDDRDKFFHAATLLREPFDRFLADNRTDAVVSDSFFHWSVDAAAERGVPRIAFLGSSMFARSCSDSMLRHNPLENAPDEPDALVLLPGLPHRVELRRSQMMDPAKKPWQWGFFKGVNAADQRSFGEVFNSFHELEPDYVEHFHKTLARRVWLVGPVALASKDMAVRGTDAPSPDADSCIRWLDAKPAGSVVYVSFGTLTTFAPAELHQLARALDLSGVNFVWVIGAAAGRNSAEWMPEGFAELIASGDRGFMVRGWAPQMLILSHAALGGFVTHCGWNSVLEAVSAGVPMVTWPRYADQFNNEKLVVELLKVGVSIGAKDYASGVETHEVIAGEVIAESIQRLMESDAIRKKANNLGVKARSAVEKGGSSYDDVGRLMDELTVRRSSVKVGEGIQAS
ncbi:scopoletin glucosyltransferase-like [Triticum dicoccoides]|uniref:scopoletin glucosyltransferase-like n=1 Tax=Triticum dicoccoides TaxID=85692 RepID=UPI00188ED86A|nr:scopoletin glucosyltransferase-like [Triticum dicoccoides]